MQDKMEQQTKIKATCKKDIVAEIKNTWQGVNGMENRNLFKLSSVREIF